MAKKKSNEISWESYEDMMKRVSAEKKKKATKQSTATSKKKKKKGK